MSLEALSKTQPDFQKPRFDLGQLESTMVEYNGLHVQILPTVLGFGSMGTVLETNRKDLALKIPNLPLDIHQARQLVPDIETYMSATVDLTSVPYNNIRFDDAHNPLRTFREAYIQKMALQQDLPKLAMVKLREMVLIQRTGTSDYWPALLLERVLPESLAEDIKRINPKDTHVVHNVHRLGPISKTIDDANDRNIIIRDIKPENILKHPEGHWVISDFGIAVLDGYTQRDNLHILGSPSYMAPEVMRGKPAHPASEQYSFALVLAQTLLQGKDPRQHILNKAAMPVPDSNTQYMNAIATNNMRVEVPLLQIMVTDLLYRHDTSMDTHAMVLAEVFKCSLAYEAQNRLYNCTLLQTLTEDIVLRKAEALFLGHYAYLCRQKATSTADLIAIQDEYMQLPDHREYAEKVFTKVTGFPSRTNPVDSMFALLAAFPKEYPQPAFA